MVNEQLTTYLNDHLAGSVVAIELLEHLAAAHAGTAREPFLTGLRADVVADRQVLEALMDRLEIARSRPRRVAAWFTEKATELKLRLDDPAGGALRLLEALEALAVGIEGKRGLWAALGAVAPDTPELQGPDYQHLARRAQEQHDRVEVVRLDTARAAFRASSQ